MKLLPGLAIVATIIFPIAHTHAEPFVDVPNPTFTEEPDPVAYNTFSWAMAAAGGDVVLIAVGDFDTIHGTAYRFDAQSGAYHCTYENPSAQVDNFFGAAVAIAGNRVFISAVEDSSVAAYAGAVYEFQRDNCQHLDTYVSPVPGYYYQFGSALAVSGNYLLVGESGADVGIVAGAGKVHVFQFGAVSPDRTFWKLGALEGESLGEAMAIVGDNVAVGAPYDAEVVSQGGAVHFFRISDGSPQGEIRKPVEDTAAYERFGSAMAAMGTDLLIGAYLDLDGGPAENRPGAAYLYEADTTDAEFGTRRAIYRNPTPEYLDRFGFSLAAVGDRVLVGAFGDDLDYANSGSAYLFDKTGGLPVQTFRKETPVENDWYGFSVASAGGNVLIGIHYDDPGGVLDAGAAYLYGNTPVGTGEDPVVVEATSSDGTPVTLEFDGVTSTGATTVEQVDCPAEPDGSSFEMCDPPVCHDISTSATIVETEDSIRICMNYGSNGCTGTEGDEANIRLRHDEDNDGTLDDITDPGYPDTTNNEICGTTSHLSLFGLALAVIPEYTCTGFESPMDRGTVTVRGNRAIPFKAKLYDGMGMELGIGALSASPVIQVMYQPGDGDPVDVSGEALPAGQGSEGNQFVYADDGFWQFNLKTKNYDAAGIYTVTMVSGDAQEYQVAPMCAGTFQID